MASPFNGLENFDLRSIPDAVLRSISRAVTAEVKRRNRLGRQIRKPGETLNLMQLRWDRRSNQHILNRLDDLMAADWSELYPRLNGDRRFYVYAHIRPGPIGLKHTGALSIDLPGLPFYIGKGCGNRAFDLQRNEGHGVELRTLLAEGRKPAEIVCILRDGLTENEAYELEAKLIYFFGTKFDAGRSGLLVNLDIPKTHPTFC